MSRLISIKEASEILSVCTKTLRTWDNDGTLSSIKTKGGHRRYNTDDVYKFINKTSYNVSDRRLTSYFKINELCELDFLDSGKVNNGRIVMIYHSESKVFYDVEITVKMDETNSYNTLLSKIDSVFIKKIK